MRKYPVFAEAQEADAGGGPEGGSQEKHEESVPVSRLKAALESAERKHQSDLEAKTAALRAEFEAKLEQAKPKAELPRRYSRAELNAAVANGQITQEQADAHWEAQIQADAEARAQRVALSTVTDVQRKDRILTEIAKYKAAAPEVMDDAHDTRQKIRDEFNYLVSLGDSGGLETQLKAIRAVLGPIEKLERARSGNPAGEPHRETGGGGESDPPKRANGKLADRLNASAKEHYQDQIKKGLYKDWADVEKALSYASPSVKRRLGLA